MSRFAIIAGTEYQSQSKMANLCAKSLFGPFLFIRAPSQYLGDS